MNTFKAVRLKRSYTFPVAAAADRVFPLLCPVSEREWLKGWACDIIHTDSGRNETGCVFTTKGVNGTETVWVSSRYDAKEGRAEFVLVTPGVMTVNMNVSLGKMSGGTTPVTFEYLWTALTGDGNKLLSSAAFEEQARQKIAWIEKSMNHFLATGTRLES